ncbi:MAG: hypothetical protein DRJ41_02460 [Thermoprotei archaeon]|nr:MAG: hypothetical protein DRJ41_02460 [Thermoprotei archaeon]
MNRMVINYVVGIVSMVAFAYISSYFPEMFSYLIIAYMVLMMGLILFMTGKSTSRMIKDVSYIEKGNVIAKISKETINKLKSKDIAILSRELSDQGKLMMLSFLPLILFIIIIFFPSLRDVFSVVGQLGRTEQERNFLSFLSFYLFIYVLSISSSMFTRIYARRKGGLLMIPSQYVVTDRGVVADKRTPIKIPVEKTKIRYDSKRKFVEIVVPGQGGSPDSRVRLYSPNPRELYNTLTGKSSKES